MFSFGYSRPFMTRGSGVSCAPPHQILPGFLNLHDSKINSDLFPRNKNKY